MQSQVAIAGQPLHPALVAIPTGAFMMTLMADGAWALGRPEWAAAGRIGRVSGIAGALVAPAGSDRRAA